MHGVYHCKPHRITCAERRRQYLKILNNLVGILVKYGLIGT